MSAVQSKFGSLLRHWRETRRLSQMALSLEANISSKHVSFLETGRNQPTREMILRLSQALEVPMRDRNLLLNCAGFAPAYRESSLDSQFVDQANEAIARILATHNPYPAIVMDADWKMLRQNDGAIALGQTLVPGAPTEGFNALFLLFDPQGLQPFVTNWEELSAVILMRLYRESLEPTASDRRKHIFNQLLSMPTTPGNWREIGSRLPGGPTVNMDLEKDGQRYSFFTTLTTFGTAQDITLQEIRIESYFPSNDVTRKLCENW